MASPPLFLYTMLINRINTNDLRYVPYDRGYELFKARLAHICDFQLNDFPSCWDQRDIQNCIDEGRIASIECWKEEDQEQAQQELKEKLSRRKKAPSKTAEKKAVKKKATRKKPVKTPPPAPKKPVIEVIEEN